MAEYKKNLEELNDIGTKTIETNRLLLRKFQISDAEQMFHNWTSDEKVSRYVSWSKHENIAETIGLVSKWLIRTARSARPGLASLPGGGSSVFTISCL